MRFESRRRRRVREAAEQPFPPAWAASLRRSWPTWELLSLDEQRRMQAMIQLFVVSKRWEPANGFDLTDEVRVLIAAQACLAVLELGLECLDGVSTIIVHPTTVVLHGQRATGTQGLVSSDTYRIDGQAHFGGPIIVVWDVARVDARHPNRGQNVVIHEFAHALDMLGGLLDGTPPMELEQQQRWVKVCTREYRAVRAGLAGPLLREYAGENPAEFFAVVSEVFFTRPVELREGKPDLYDVLSGFYQQDPAARVPAPPALVEPGRS